MALTPEEMERIAGEERQKLEEEAYRAHVRKMLRSQQSAKARNLPAIIAFASLVMLFITAYAAGWFHRPQARAAAPFTKSQPLPAYIPARPDPLVVSPVPQTQDRSRAETISEKGIPAGIQALLSRWRDTLVSHNLEGHVDCYGPIVYVFYNRKNVNHSAVREDRQRMLAKYPEFRKYTIANVQPESVTPSRAVITFDKEWDTAGAKRFAGAERGRLTLEKLNGEWKIVGEQEARVYWVKR